MDKTSDSEPPKWRPGRTYAQDALVVHQGVVYRCRSTHRAAADFEVDRKANRWSVERARAKRPRQG